MQRIALILAAGENFFRWRLYTIVALLLVSGLGSLFLDRPAYSQTPPAATKTPPGRQVPDAAQLKTVQLKIQEVFGSEIESATSAAAKEAVAAKMLKMAEESQDDPAVYYALLNTVRELSIGAGNYPQSMSATKKLTDTFALDSLEEQYQVLRQCGETCAATSPGLLEVANVSFQMAEEFAKNGDTDQALRFSRIAHAAATKGRSAALLKQITAFGTDLTARENDRKALPAAEQKLAADPRDPAANLILGRWHWFRLGDSQKAMPYLAKTAASPLQKAALAELEQPATPAAQVALADQWWTLAQTVKEDAIKNCILARAADWYSTASPTAKGADKLKADKRSAEIQKLLGTKPAVAATVSAPANAPVEKTVKTSLGSELIYIPPGKFLMGSPDNDPDRKPHENQVPVEITQGFYLGKHEVKQGEWKALMGTEPWMDKKLNKPSQNIEAGDDFVAVFIKHGQGFEGQIEPDSAMAFCQKLSQKEGRKYRLPTEAEWEYACRAGSQTPYSFGADGKELRDHAWYAKGSKFRIQQVGVKKPNAWGLYDMLGNASEWCLDSYHPDKPELPGGRNPLGSSSNNLQLRILRGGYFAGMDESLYRSASRAWANYNDKRNHHGFRLVLEAASVKP